MGYWGALQGKQIHEKNLKSKILCQTPFNKIIHAVPESWLSGFHDLLIYVRDLPTVQYKPQANMSHFLY